MASFLSIVSSLLVGAFLAVLPWMTIWETNYLLQAHPALRSLLLSAFTRGAVTGLGLVNVLLALHDVHERLTAAGERG